MNIIEEVKGMADDLSSRDQRDSGSKWENEVLLKQPMERNLDNLVIHSYS